MREGDIEFEEFPHEVFIKTKYFINGKISARVGGVENNSILQDQ
jgi:hypothetical protein